LQKQDTLKFSPLGRPNGEEEDRGGNRRPLWESNPDATAARCSHTCSQAAVQPSEPHGAEGTSPSVAVTVRDVTGDVVHEGEFVCTMTVSDLHDILVTAGVLGASLQEGAQLLMGSKMLNPSELLTSCWAGDGQAVEMCLVRDAALVGAVRLSQAMLKVSEELFSRFTSTRLRVFCLRVQGDVFRCLAEFPGSTLSDADESASKSYIHAFELANGCSPYDPIRIALSLSYAVFVDEVLNDREKAVNIVRLVLEEVLEDPDSQDEVWYAWSKYPCSKLKQCMARWRWT